MPAAADLLPMADLPDEFTGPVSYGDRWLVLACVLVAAVLVYFAVVWWTTRPPRVTSIARAHVDVPGVRVDHLRSIDKIVAQVRTGSLPAREGHQGLSEVVRSYVATVTTLPARTMALADFRARAPQELVDAIELMYPPEFAPDSAVATDTFDAAVDRARRLVSSWG